MTASESPPPARWVWLDLEMTGLNPETDGILEIATVVTDAELRVLAEGPNLILHQPDSLLQTMNDWCVRTHGASGLTEAVRNSSVGLAEAERRTLEFLHSVAEPGTAPLCGNSIWQDRRFLERYMPELAAFFHYRQLDVSSLKILAAAWAPQLVRDFGKETRHRARDDVYDSIAELRFYRKALLAAALQGGR